MKIGGNILVFNSGSSSLKFQLFETDGEVPTSKLRGMVGGLGERPICEWVYRGERTREAIAANSHQAATRQIFVLLEQTIDAKQSLLDRITAVGHRIVHGGGRFFEPTLITNESLELLATSNALVPLHNPFALEVVQECRNRLAAVPMVAVFDTAYFHELPEYARTYALPAAWGEGTQPIRRYGFHGLAHRYMAERFAAMQTENGRPLRLVTLQLGHGCSAAAIRDGHAVDTSMGFTPLEGLVMATRPGDLDVGIVLHWLGRRTATTAELIDSLNHRAGLLGLSGISADMQELLRLEAQGHARAHLAIEAFCYRARKYIGAYLAVLGGAEAIIFGGGIGENAAVIRERICAGMQWCGLELDEEANRTALGRAARISPPNARPAAYVIPVDEEALIVRDTLTFLESVRDGNTACALQME